LRARSSWQKKGGVSKNRGIPEKKPGGGWGQKGKVLTKKIRTGKHFLVFKAGNLAAGGQACENQEEGEARLRTRTL